MYYTELIKDDYIKNIFKDIDRNNHRTWNHGLSHALNVVENIEKLSSLFHIENKDLEYLKISGYLHDLGQIDGKENHELRSRKIVGEYLKGKIDKTGYNKILLAIEKHHEHDKVNELSLFEHLLLFADKMDFTFKRLDIKYLREQNIKDCAEMHILSVDFAIEDNKFIVLIKMDKRDVLKTWAYFSKIKKRIKEFANKINMGYEIRIVYKNLDII